MQELKKNDLTVSQYLNQEKSLSDELKAAGKPISTAEFNAIIYRNIGTDYHSIITALNLRPEPVSFYELHGQLVAHEILLKSSLLPRANMVVKNLDPLLPTLASNSSANPSRGRGSFNPNYSRSNQSSRSRGSCLICGFRNHTASPCRRHYQRLNPASSGHSTTGHLNATPQGYQCPLVPHANYAAMPSSTWYTDTAANHHVTPDIHSLSSVADYNGNDNLHVGNGLVLQIAGNASPPSACGHLHLKKYSSCSSRH